MSTVLTLAKALEQQKKAWKVCPKVIRDKPTKRQAALLRTYNDCQFIVQRLQGYPIYFPYSPLYIMTHITLEDFHNSMRTVYPKLTPRDQVEIRPMSGPTDSLKHHYEQT